MEQQLPDSAIQHPSAIQCRSKGGDLVKGFLTQSGLNNVILTRVPIPQHDVHPSTSEERFQSTPVMYAFHDPLHRHERDTVELTVGNRSVELYQHHREGCGNTYLIARPGAWKELEKVEIHPDLLQDLLGKTVTFEGRCLVDFNDEKVMNEVHHLNHRTSIRPPVLSINQYGIHKRVPPTADFMEQFAPDHEKWKVLAQKGGLDLNIEVNDMKLTVLNHTTKGRIFCWPSNKRIVVCDIDGTITTGDLQQFHHEPRLHENVGALLNAIHANGYGIVYLSARPIGMIPKTAEFLFKEQKDGVTLPEGPIIHAGAASSSIIHGKTTTFKAQRLKEIAAAFHGGSGGLHAGFGNQGSDCTAYRTAKIPRVFIIKQHEWVDVSGSTDEGTLQQRASWYSYESLLTAVNQIFPEYL